MSIVVLVPFKQEKTEKITSLSIGNHENDVAIFILSDNLRTPSQTPVEDNSPHQMLVS